MYGGTKEEMERLLADAEELSGVKYDIDNLGDVYSAIHVIQEDLNLTGVAADEAKTTFTGSFQAMQAAATNFLAELTTGGDVQTSLQNLMDSAMTFLTGNLLPMLGNLISSIPPIVSTLITTYMPQLFDQGVSMLNSISSGLVESVPAMLAEFLPKLMEFTTSLREHFGDFVDAGINLVLNLAQGLIAGLPTFIQTVPTIISNICGLINDNMPKILLAAGQIVIMLAKGIVDSIPVIVQEMPKIVQAIVDVISAVNWINLGAKIITALGNGLKSMAGGLGGSASEVIHKVVEIFKNIKWSDVGANIIKGIINGLKSAASALFDFIVDLCASMLSKIKEFFKIGSPSKLMNQEVGRWIPAGIAVGIEGNMDSVTSAIDEMNNETLKSATAGIDFSASNVGEIKSQNYDQQLSNLEAALSNLNTNVEVTLEGDAKRLFKAMQSQSRNYKNLTGNNAFA